MFVLDDHGKAAAEVRVELGRKGSDLQHAAKLAVVDGEAAEDASNAAAQRDAACNYLGALLSAFRATFPDGFDSVLEGRNLVLSRAEEIVRWRSVVPGRCGCGALDLEEGEDELWEFPTHHKRGAPCVVEPKLESLIAGDSKITRDVVIVGAAEYSIGQVVDDPAQVQRDEQLAKREAADVAAGAEVVQELPPLEVTGEVGEPQP